MKTLLRLLAGAGLFAAALLYAPLLLHAQQLPVPSGVFATGDIVYAPSDDDLDGIAAVAAGQVLTSAGTGTVPAWSATPALTGGLSLDDGSGAAPTIVLTDGTDETVTIGKTDAAALTFTSSASGSNDGVQILTGNLFVGNGTPGETINGEDAYIEGIVEVDGTANFDGLLDADGGISIGSTTLNTATLTAQARGWFTICGDATTVNNNTVYYGPSQAVVDSATAGMVTCNTDAAGSTTEATADAPAIQATAIYPLGMVCYSTDQNATVTYTLRSAEAAITPAISVSIADDILSGTATATATTAIASGATVAVAVASTADMGATSFICYVSYAF